MGVESRESRVESINTATILNSELSTLDVLTLPQRSPQAQCIQRQWPPAERVEHAAHLQDHAALLPAQAPAKVLQRQGGDLEEQELQRLIPARVFANEENHVAAGQILAGGHVSLATG